MRLIFLLALILAVWIGYSLVRRRMKELNDRRKAQRRLRPATDMVRCDHCGLHIPREQAVAAAGRHYCSAAHRDAARG